MAAEREFKLTFLGDARKAVGAIGDVERKLGGLQAKIPPVALGVAGLGAAAGGALAVGMFKAASETAAYADEIEEASIRTGLGTGTLQELTHAANLTGSSMEGLETSVRKMQRFVADASEGNKTAIETLDRLGVTFDELEGKSVDEQFMRLAGAVAAVEDDTLRADAAMTLFGKTGTALLPMLDQGTAGLAEMRQEAHELGLVMSEEDVAAAAQLQDNLDKLNSKVGALKREVGNALVPVLIEVSDVMLEDLFPAIGSIAAMFGAAAGRVGDLVEMLEKVPGAAAAAKAVLPDPGEALKRGASAIPGVDVFRSLASVADMLGFDNGGVVPGPRGSAQLAVVHGGETILPTHKTGGGMPTIVINVQGSLLSTAGEIETAVTRALTQIQQRGGYGLV